MNQLRDELELLFFVCFHSLDKARGRVAPAGQSIQHMAISDNDERFWRAVWPKLKIGAWRYEWQTAPPAIDVEGGEVANNQITAAGGKVSTLKKGSDRSSSSSDRSNSDEDCASNDDNNSNNGEYDGRKTQDKHEATEKSSKVAVFFPPALGVASEALEEAMRRNLPADGSAGEERLDCFEGVDAIVELLTQVPGFPGAMSFGAATNMDAVAAAAESVSVRAPAARRRAPARPPSATARESGGRAVEWKKAANEVGAPKWGASFVVFA